jgi:hypothetical protein
MPFLISAGQFIKRKVVAQPFDYASIYLDTQLLSVCITRGRGEVLVSIAPRGLPSDRSELIVVLEALGYEQYSELSLPISMGRIDDILNSQWDRINAAFSDQSYPDFKISMLRIIKGHKISTRQLEWEIEKGRYHPR